MARRDRLEAFSDYFFKDILVKTGFDLIIIARDIFKIFNIKFFNFNFTIAVSKLRKLMNLNFRALLFISLFAGIVSSPTIYAKTNFQGNNYSGLYTCKGSNISVGDYEVFVTLKFNKINSHGKFGVYDLITETENNVAYQGQAITNGNKLSLTFKLSDANHADYSTGLGEFKKLSRGRWQFINDYYEPDDTGGNYGHEVCTMKYAPAKPTNKTKSAKKVTKIPD